MPGIPTPAVSQFHGLRSDAGLKTAARRIATGERFGRWANARAATQTVAAQVGGRSVRRGNADRGKLRSPRAWAFMLLGLDAYCAAFPMISTPAELRLLLADRLMSILGAVETPDWVWFEEGLAYDNARLPQALIVTGIATKTPAYVEAGLRSLRWLMTQQTTAHGSIPARRHRRLRRTAPSHPGRSISSRWKRPRRSRPVSRRGARITMSSGRPKQRAYSHGFSAATICPSRWSIWKPGVAAMACIPIAPTRTAAANPSCLIFSVLPKFVSLRASATSRDETRRALRA